MLHILLTTIISYTTNIREINKQYHDTFRYKYSDSFGYEVLRGRSIIYNWRDSISLFDRYMRDRMIYNKFCDQTQHQLPANY